MKQCSQISILFLFFLYLQTNFMKHTSTGPLFGGEPYTGKTLSFGLMVGVNADSIGKSTDRHSLQI